MYNLDLEMNQVSKPSMAETTPLTNWSSAVVAWATKRNGNSTWHTDDIGGLSNLGSWDGHWFIPGIHETGTPEPPLRRRPEVRDLEAPGGWAHGWCHQTKGTHVGDWTKKYEETLGYKAYSDDIMG